MKTRDFIHKTKTKIMKTGGTLNFLKRTGVMLMLLAIFVTSCNKYDDDFQALKDSIAALDVKVNGVAQLQSDLTAAAAKIAALQTSVAGLPNTASIAALQTALTAITATINTIKTDLAAVATAGKATDVVIASLKTSLAQVIADMAKNNTAMDVKLAELKANLALAATKTDVAAAQKAIVDQVVLSSASTDKNVNDKIAALKTDIEASIAAGKDDVNAKIAALQVIVKDGNAANALKVQEILDKLNASKTADDATAIVIEGLKASLLAQDVVLAQLLANTVKEVGIPTIAGTMQHGIELVATAISSTGVVIPTTTTVLTYEWQSASTATGTYAAISGAGSTNKYTLQLTDVGRFIKVKVTSTSGVYTGTGTSAAGSVVVGQVILTGVTIGNYTSATIVGDVLTTSIAPVSTLTTATYVWEAATVIGGTYTVISGATASTYKLTTNELGKYIRVTITGTGAYFGTLASPESTNAVGLGTIAAATFTPAAGNNLLTITLSGAEFKANSSSFTMSSANFTFAGLDAAILAAGVYTRVSSTVVTVYTGSLTLTNAAVNSVTVKNTGILTTSITAGAAIVATTSTTLVLTQISVAAIAGVTAPATDGTPVTTVTGTGYTGTVSWSGSPVTFASGTAYTATITLTPAAGYTLLGVASNFFTVAGATGANTGSVTNLINSGVVKVLFPATAPISLDLLATAPAQYALALTLPVTGATAQTSIIDASGKFTATVVWTAPGATAISAAAPGVFGSVKTYTATVTILPSVGYTITGMRADIFKLTGATSITNLLSSDQVTVVCPATL